MELRYQNITDQSVEFSKKNQKARLKNPILSVILFLISIGILGVAYHLIQKTRCLLWTMTLRSA